MIEKYISKFDSNPLFS